MNIQTFLLILAVVAILLLICFALIGIKILVKKNGQFKRSCASVDPYTGKRLNCICGKESVLDSCENDDKHYEPLEVNKELLKEASLFKQDKKD